MAIRNQVYTGKRGQAFENTLDYTNQIYSRQARCLIHKRPTPVKVLKSKGTRVLSGFFESKSTVDYDGIYKGRAIVYEAKSTAEKRFNLKLLHDHQIEYLQAAEKQGAISFLIVEMRAISSVLIIPNGMLQKYLKDAKSGGRKSIPMDDLEVYGYPVKSQNGVPLDYLSVVDQLVELKTA